MEMNPIADLESFALLDLEHIRDIFGGAIQRSMWEELVGLFEEEGSVLLGQVQLQTESGEALGVSAVLHSLRGAAMNMGAIAFGEKLKICEQQQQEVLTASEINELSTLFEASLDAMRNLTNEE
jgi:HPt (histidine-containing phosphotransfer) domain-containing protein